MKKNTNVKNEVTVVGELKSNFREWSSPEKELFESRIEVKRKSGTVDTVRLLAGREMAEKANTRSTNFVKVHGSIIIKASNHTYPKTLLFVDVYDIKELDESERKEKETYNLVEVEGKLKRYFVKPEASATNSEENQGGVYRKH